MTARTLLVRGMLVGVAAGLLACVFAYVVGEPPLNAAIAFEAAHTAAGTGEPELVGRQVQSTAGLLLAAVLYGAALGGVFAIAFGFAYGRLGGLGARATSLLVAGAGFLSVEAVPFLKYPANPPAVGDPHTIGRRTVLYFAVIGVSVLVGLLAVLTARALHPRLGTWNAATAGAGLFLVVAAVAAALLPAVDEVPADFPATVLWRFRVASLGTQLTLWATLGVLFGALTARGLRSARSTCELSTVG